MKKQQQLSKPQPPSKQDLRDALSQVGGELAQSQVDLEETSHAYSSLIKALGAQSMTAFVGREPGLPISVLESVTSGQLNISHMTIEAAVALRDSLGVAVDFACALEVRQSEARSISG